MMFNLIFAEESEQIFVGIIISSKNTRKVGVREMLETAESVFEVEEEYSGSDEDYMDENSEYDTSC